MKRMLKLSLLLALVLVLSAAIPVVAQDDATVVVGTNAEYPPFESVDDNDDIIGFDIDLMNAIAADAGLEIEYVNTRWDGIFVALSEGEFDAVISAATITDEREEIIDFSDPYFNAGQSIAVSAAMAEEVSGPEDLAGLRVGVQLGTTGDEYASEIEGAEVVRFDEITLAFQALGAGEVDAIVNDGPTSADIIANSPDLEAVIVGEPLTDEFYGIAVNPERSDVLDAVNSSLANVIADGTYAEIYEEWFGQQPSAAFMPMEDMGEDMMMEIDRTDPASTAIGLVGTFFRAETPADLLAFACENANPDSPLLPTQEDLDGFEGVSADLSEFMVNVEEMDDGTAEVTFDGTITLIVGGNESPIPASLLAQQLGIESITLYKNDSGEWEICPE